MMGKPRSIVVPVVLIGFGIIFLLNNLGVLQWNIWEAAARLWPILLVAVGLDIILGRRSGLAPLLALALVLAVMAGAVWLFLPGSPVGWAPAATEIRQQLAGAQRAEVEIGYGLGTLRVGAHAEPDLLVVGELAAGPGAQVDREFRVAGDTAYLRLRQEGMQGLPFLGRGGRRAAWDLRFVRDLPLRLQIRTGVGSAELDLAELRVHDLEVHSGVGQTRLTLPAAGLVQASINGGVGETTVVIPAGMAARIGVRTGVGSVEVSGDYERRGDLYISPGYDLAASRLDLQVRGGVGRVRIRGAALQ